MSRYLAILSAMRAPDLNPVVRKTAGTAQRSAGALATSLAAHALVVVVVFAGSRKVNHSSALLTRSVPQVELLSLPPIPAPGPIEPRPAQGRRKVVPRPQVTPQRDLPDEAFFRPDPPPPELPMAMPAATTTPDPAPAPRPHELASAEAAASTMESEAQRLFGPRRTGAGPEVGPVPARSWIHAVTEDRENDCVPRAPVARAPGTPIEMGLISGIVYREGTREPLAGAFLQILGTPYSTFADARGAYALSFDRTLVDDCRTQYVQVSRDGFAPRRLILSLGHRVSNDIPLNRR